MAKPITPPSMGEEIKELLDAHWKWLRDSTALRDIGTNVEITTPYLDRHNDMLQIYVQKVDKGFLLHDDGYVLNDLAMSGFKMAGKHRLAVLDEVLNGFGVKRSDKHRLEVFAGAGDFPMKKHDIVQAMLAVGDMFYMAQPNVAQMFVEDVAAWLDGHKIRYVYNSRLSGRSGYTHHFDFIIPKSPKAPERALRALNGTNKNTIEAAIFSWQDTREARSQETDAYVLVNDIEKPASPTALQALRNYAITPVPWSQREQYVAALAA
ncbi:MAG: DUF1829 domain-containing protein [Candidatus Thermoplasmatota archaeon]